MTSLSHKLPQECETDPECLRLRELRDLPELLAAAHSGANSELALQAKLRQQYPDELVRLALLTNQLRQQAAGKFTRASTMWFDRVGLEQSTPEPVARHKSQRFPSGGVVWDLCCGIGGDTIALAEHHPVIAVDLRPAACLRCHWNAELYQVAERVELRIADAAVGTWGNDLVHLDPDRRAGGAGRAQRIEDYVPNLARLQQLTQSCRGGAIKVGPASNFGGKFPGAEIELVSLHGECKEATVWFGELAGSHPCRATVLPQGVTLAGHPLATAVPITPLGAYLYDPDPAVVRAGLVDLCAEQLGLTRLDAAEEYLTADQLVLSPFVTPFRVQAELPNNERELRQQLRARETGVYEIKSRHLRIQADTLRRRLPATGDKAIAVIFARLHDKARLVLAERVAH